MNMWPQDMPYVYPDDGQPVIIYLDDNLTPDELQQAAEELEELREQEYLRRAAHDLIPSAWEDERLPQPIRAVGQIIDVMCSITTSLDAAFTRITRKFRGGERTC